MKCKKASCKDGGSFESPALFEVNLLDIGSNFFLAYKHNEEKLILLIKSILFRSNLPAGH